MKTPLILHSRVAYKDALEKELKIEPVNPSGKLQEVKEASEDGAVFIVKYWLKTSCNNRRIQGRRN